VARDAGASQRREAERSEALHSGCVVVRADSMKGLLATDARLRGRSLKRSQSAAEIDLLRTRMRWP
jgi:hypothetical protein